MALSGNNIFSEIHMNGARSVPALLCSQFENHQTRILPLLVIPHHQILNNPLDFSLPRSSHFIFVTTFESLYFISLGCVQRISTHLCWHT